LLSQWIDYASWISYCDINQDGIGDILITSKEYDLVTWLEIDESGEVSNTGLVSFSLYGGQVVAEGDLDGDGETDFVSSSWENDMIYAIYSVGNEAGFGRAVPVFRTNNVTGIAVLDVDGNGTLDIVAGRDNFVFWVENSATGWILNENFIIDGEISGFVDLAWGDLDGDGDNDIVSSGDSDGKIVWYENEDGAGQFGFPRAISLSSLGVRDIKCVDIDSDNDLDIVSAETMEDQVSLYLNHGNGVFDEEIVIASEWRVLSIDSADLDGDGLLDIVACSNWGDRVLWYRNLSDDGFSDGHVIESDYDGLRSITCVDIDGDLDIDILCSAGANDGLRVYINSDGIGNFNESCQLSSGSVGYVDAVCVDTDGDEDLDVVALNSVYRTLDHYKNVSDVISVDKQERVRDYRESLVYPNPITSSSIIRLSTNMKNIRGANIYDILGRLVGNLSCDWASGSGEVMLFGDVDLPSGKYFVLMSNGSANEIRTFSVVR
ncbi:MAG: T9SS type A sorting domain-containing protein, partial [Calditrichaeota bacterium]|nr:T9SS type A sorting domain-containing protein [Calditrichota bacterium]